MTEDNEYDFHLVYKTSEIKVWYCRKHQRFVLSGFDEPPHQQETQQGVVWLDAGKPIKVEGRNFYAVGTRIVRGSEFVLSLHPQEALKVAALIGMSIEMENGDKIAAMDLTGGISQTRASSTVLSAMEDLGMGVGPFYTLDDVRDLWEGATDEQAREVLRAVETRILETIDSQGLMDRAVEMARKKSELDSAEGT